MNVFVVLATYNERDNISRMITIFEEEVFPKIKEHTMHILVADDSSPDGTADVVKDLMKKYKNLYLDSGQKKGLGAAYIRAMTKAIDQYKADILVELDSDLQHDPRNVPVFLEKLKEGYDIVLGTRYSDGGSMPPNWPFQRKLFSVSANILMRSITGRFHIHDWTGGYRAFKKEVFLKEKNKIGKYQGYTFQVAFLYKALLDGYTVAETPIHFHDRTNGNSKIAPLEYIINVLTYVILERIHELQRFIKFLVVGGTGFIIQVVSQELAVFLGSPDAYAAGIGAESAIICNFFLNNMWTFQDTHKIKQSSNLFVKFLKFNVASAGSIFIQAAAVWIAERLFGVYIHTLGFTVPVRILILFPTIVFVVLPLNYFIYNTFVWKTQYLKKDEKDSHNP